jgi:hypothetical protein
VDRRDVQIAARHADPRTTAAAALNEIMASTER